MTAIEFEKEKNIRPCRHCGQTACETELNPNNNGLLVRCGNCGSKYPWGHLQFLKQNERRKSRPPLPNGETLDSIWAKFGDCCVICSSPKSFLEQVGIGRQVHHVLPYAEHGHQGPLIPVCIGCHATATERQRLHWYFRNAVEGKLGERAKRPASLKIA
jgi:hypothetical protein